MNKIDMILQQVTDMRNAAVIAAKDVLNIDEASIYTSLSKRCIYDMVAEKTLPHYRQKSKLYFLKEELKNWLMEKRVASKDEMAAQAAAYCRRRAKA